MGISQVSALKTRTRKQNENLGKSMATLRIIQKMEVVEKLYLKHIKLLQYVQVITSETDIFVVLNIQVYSIY